MNLADIVKKKLLFLGAETTDSFLVAVSGGGDSTALLLAMHAAFGDEKRLTAAHLDHAVRPDSRSDLIAVTKLCRTLNIDTVTERLDPDEIESKRHSQGSMEAAMRILRYRFLDRAARNSGSRWIVTGHTADDQSETILFRALRRMDWRSFGGIPEIRENILRPFIDVPRRATWRYCKAMGVSPLTDPSNFDENFTRSRIRNKVLPEMENYFGIDLPDHLRRMGRSAARLLIAEGKLLEADIPASAAMDTGTLDSNLVQKLPKVLQRRMLIDFLHVVLGEFPSRKLTDDVLEFVLAGRNGELSLSGGRTLTLSYGTARAGKTNKDLLGSLPSTGIELTIPGSLVLPSAGVVIQASETVVEKPGVYPSGKTALISRKSVPGSLWVRKRRPGDHFIPLGMVNKKKLKDFFIDRKVPSTIRDRTPILLDDQGEIVWVGGIEISRKAALSGLKGEEAVLLRIEDLSVSGDSAVNGDYGS